MTDQLKNILESLIFISQEPLTVEKIKEVLAEYSGEEVEQAVLSILKAYSANEKGIQVIQAAGGYLFSTNPQYDPWVRRLLRVERKNKLSPAALETLSAVAYHQPVTLSQISTIRGVDSYHCLRTLLEKGLVKIAGRKKGPGKPLIYRTTIKFLTYFGLKSIADLPSQDEILKILEEEGDVT